MYLKMNIVINKSLPEGKVTAPPSKSFAIRALICGAFSKGTTIKNISFCDDVNAVISCLKVLGAEIDIFENYVKIGNLDVDNIKNNVILDCKESATVFRFLIPICLTLGKKVIIKGSKRLFERNITPYKKLCDEKGFLFEQRENELELYGKFSCGNYEIKADFSSHFVSGMLIALSLLDGKSTLAVKGERVSKPYIDITKSVLEDFGISIKEDVEKYTVLGRKTFESREYTIEGDFSNSAYLEALSVFGGSVNVLGVKENSLQGDKIYKEYFENIKSGKREFSVKDCPDLAPILYAFSCAFGGGKFTGTNRLSLKESDRNIAMMEELEKFSVKMDIFDDYVLIDASNLSKPAKALSSHNDHRIFMALVPLCLKFGGEIESVECVNKSFPEYFSFLKKLNVQFKLSERK